MSTSVSTRSVFKANRALLTLLICYEARRSGISLTENGRVRALTCNAADVTRAEPTRILEYIRATWRGLTRTHKDLATAAADPKLSALAGGRWPVYIARNEDLRKISAQLRREMAPDACEKIRLKVLPEDLPTLREHGLLYLPHSYVVPGGRFNEMYGWDSFFIEMGLLRDGQIDLAKDMTQNALYEVRAYGKVLNANRTYYLTRSQPPFLTQMVMAVYRLTRDRQWLEVALPEIEHYYQYWTSEPHLTPETGLSRYYDPGIGPAPEVLASEHDQSGRTDYDLIREYFRAHHVPDYDVSQYYDASRDRLTDLFYTGDRSMRESGFDPSGRFGPFSIDIIHYNPVCLNSLLYLMEEQTAAIFKLLGREAEASAYRKRAQERASRINQLMWNSHDGLYCDYNFVRRKIRRYPYLTTFYPLWAGIAGRDQAERVAQNIRLFEQPGGLQTSTARTGDQWDSPFGWAPLEWIAIEGLRRYGYEADAFRIAQSYRSMIEEEFERTGNIEEKYDVVRRRADVSRTLRYGYRTNEAGFGWTNSVFTALLDEVPHELRQEA